LIFCQDFPLENGSEAKRGRGGILVDASSAEEQHLERAFVFSDVRCRARRKHLDFVFSTEIGDGGYTCGTGTVLNRRTTTSQKYAAVPSRARIEDS